MSPANSKSAPKKINPKKIKLTTVPAKKVGKPAAPAAASPKSTAPKSAAPKSAAPKSVAPKSAAPTKAASKAVAKPKKAAEPAARPSSAATKASGRGSRELASDPRDVVSAVFEAAGWDAVQKQLESFVVWRVETNDEPILGMVEAELFLDASRFSLYFVHKEPVPAKRRGEVMELVTRLNDELVDGAYLLSLDDGLLRYRTGVDFSGTTLAPVLVRNLILHGAQVTSAHDEIVRDVADARREPVEALAALTALDEA